MIGVPSRNERTPSEPVHIFDNGVRILKRHLLASQLDRYREINLHEPVEEHWFRAVIEDRAGRQMRFADVGAGVGYYSILAKIICPHAAITCFEPFSGHARAIAENLTSNGFEESAVRVIEAAISDRTGVAPFVAEHYGSRLLPGEGRSDDPRVSVVRTMTLAEAIGEVTGPLDLVKVDVQGDELKVIEGAQGAADRIGAWILGTHGSAVHHTALVRLQSLGYGILFEDPFPSHQPDGIIVATR